MASSLLSQALSDPGYLNWLKGQGIGVEDVSKLSPDEQTYMLGLYPGQLSTPGGFGSYNEQGQLINSDLYKTQPAGWDSSTGQFIFNGVPQADTFSPENIQHLHDIYNANQKGNFGDLLAKLTVPALGAGLGALALGAAAPAAGGIDLTGATFGNAPGILAEGAGFLPVSADAAGAAGAGLDLTGLNTGFFGEGIGAGGAASFSLPAELSSIPGLELLNTGLVGNAGGLSAADIEGLRQMGQAAGLSGQALQQFVDSGGTQGSTAAGGGGVGTGDSSSLTNILKSLFPNSTLGSLLGGALQGGLGYLGAQQQSNALKDVYNQQMALGAPYRDMLAQTYQPGYSVFNDQAARDAATRAADVASRSYSAQYGNPFDSGTAQAGIYNSVLSGVALPQLNTTRSQLGTFGQLGLNTAGTASLQNAENAGSGLNAIGYGIGTALNPQISVQDLLKQISSNNQYRLV